MNTFPKVALVACVTGQDSAYPAALCDSMVKLAGFHVYQYNE